MSNKYRQAGAGVFIPRPPTSRIEGCLGCVVCACVQCGEDADFLCCSHPLPERPLPVRGGVSKICHFLGAH